MFITLLLFLCVNRIFGQYVGTPDLNVWPLPQNVSTGWDIASLVPSQFSFVRGGNLAPADSHVLDEAFKRYSVLTFEPHQPSTPAYVLDLFDNKRQLKPHVPPTRVVSLNLLGLRVTTTTYSSPLVLGVDESYTLFVPGVEGCGSPCSRWASLNASTVWGALRGLETFSQMVTYELLPQGVFSYVVSVAPALIVDWPRFPWRGLMVDSSRHFLDIPSLESTIDAMQYNKLNVFHWHITDAESFAFHSLSRPALNKGTYAPSAQYTAADIKAVVEYARLRGVIVVPETDTPGHTASWGVGYPEILTDCWDWIRTKKAPFLWPAFDSMALDVTKNITFDVVADVVTELQTLFPASFYHIGGDEVISGCWNSSADVTAWMRDNGYASQQNASSAWVYDFSGLQHMWTLKMIELLFALNRTAIVWDEALSPDRPLSNETIINVWTGVDALQTALSLGHRAVMSYGYYLDKQAPLGAGPNCANVHWMWMWTWHDFYLSDPLGWFEVSKEQEGLVLGGEMSSWGESASELSIQSRIWGRGPAAAERFWSDASVNDITDAQLRLGRFWCRLQGRGIGAAPSMPGFCSSYLHSQSETNPTNMHPAQNALIVLAGLSGVLSVTTILLLFDRFRKKRQLSSLLRDSTDESLNYKATR